MNLPDGLYAPPITHRGLWTPGEVAENSLVAFERACQAGYGIELDVRMSHDGEPMVFHDANLERLTGAEASIWDLTAVELQALPLLGGPGGIPTLAETLKLVDGRAMLLVEIKSGPDGGGELEGRTAELLGRYRGPVAVISFDPAALAWFALNHPEWPRGLDAAGLSEREIAESQDDVVGLFEAKLALTAPHFLVLELESATSPVGRAQRAAGLPVIAWTARAIEDVDRVANDCDNFIFEGFTSV